jgi:hypothetical protein
MAATTCPCSWLIALVLIRVRLGLIQRSHDVLVGAQEMIGPAGSREGPVLSALTG